MSAAGGGGLIDVSHEKLWKMQQNLYESYQNKGNGVPAFSSVIVNLKCEFIEQSQLNRQDKCWLWIS